MAASSLRRSPPGRSGRFGFLRFWQFDPDASVSMTSSILGFALSGLAALVLVSVGIIFSARENATDEAISDSIQLTEVVSRSLVEQVLDEGVISGDQRSLRALDAAVRTQVLGASVVRVKLWNRDGTIVYSDASQLIGQRFPLPDDELKAYDTGVAAAEVSDLNRPENVYERSFKKLLEVYFPVRTKGGSTLLFEAYLPYSAVASNASDIRQRFMPALIGGLVVLAIVQIPLAWSLAYRLRRRQDERESLLRLAVEASERERGILAGELHDGAVQSLISQSLRITAAADRLTGTAPADTVSELRQVSQQARNTVQELRTLLLDLYPPNLSNAGLEPALSDLAAPLRANGTEVTISVLLVRLPEHVERVMFRCAREALRNVLAHADARRVEVVVDDGAKTAVLSVSDDGCGFSTERREARRAAGHLGLDLVESLAREAGGSCEVTPREGGGTLFVVRIPLP